MLTLHGLAIDVVDDPAAPPAAAADVRWVREPAARPFETAPPPGWAWRVFDGQGGAACGFAISPDGRQVLSQATGVVREADLFGLFAEAVMRAVLHRQRLVSFHAAALARDGDAVLLIGDKGAGKSSFAAALAASGWTLLADDLTRVLEAGRVWRVASGHRQLKLNPDVAAALGYDPGRLARRWTPGQPRDATPNKLVLPCADAVQPALAPLAAICVIGARVAGARGLSVAALPPPAGLAVLLQNLSDDPFGEPVPPTAEAKAAVMSLLASAPLRRLALPDDLAQLAPLARALAPAQLAGPTPPASG